MRHQWNPHSVASNLRVYKNLCVVLRDTQRLATLTEAYQVERALCYSIKALKTNVLVDTHAPQRDLSQQIGLSILELVAFLAPCLAVHTEMLAYHAMDRKRHRRTEQNLVPTSHDLKTFGLYVPCFGAIVRGNVPLAAIAKPHNQETVVRSQHRFQFPMESLHLAHR